MTVECWAVGAGVPSGSFSSNPRGMYGFIPSDACPLGCDWALLAHPCLCALISVDNTGLFAFLSEVTYELLCGMCRVASALGLGYSLLLECDKRLSVWREVIFLE